MYFLLFISELLLNDHVEPLTKTLDKQQISQLNQPIEEKKGSADKNSKFIIPVNHIEFKCCKFLYHHKNIFKEVFLSLLISKNCQFPESNVFSRQKICHYQ